MEDGDWWCWRFLFLFLNLALGKLLEALPHRVPSLSSSVLCKEREVNPTRLPNPCQGPALSRTQGTSSQGFAAKYSGGSVPGPALVAGEDGGSLETKRGFVSSTACPCDDTATRRLVPPPPRPRELFVCIRDVNIWTSLTRGWYIVTRVSAF